MAACHRPHAASVRSPESHVRSPPPRYVQQSRSIGYTTHVGALNIAGLRPRNLSLSKLVPVTSRLFRSEPVSHDVFGDYPRDDKVQQVIFAPGFGAAATHLESAKRMTANHCAGAGSIDVDVSS